MNPRDEEVLAAVAGRGHGKSGWIRTNCPFCVLVRGREDRRASLGLHALSGRWHCFRCGERGAVRPDLLGAVERVEADALRGERIQPPEGFIPLGWSPGLDARCAEPMRAYLRARRVEERTWREAGIGTVLRGRFAHRIIVPIRRLASSDWLGFVARSIVPDDPKRYLNSSGAIGGLFNEAALYRATDEPALVVEGVFDALPSWPDAVALLGKPTPLRTSLLARAVRPLVVCLDGDAWREGEALAMRLHVEDVRARALKLPLLTDPGDFDPATLRDWARACIENRSKRWQEATEVTAARMPFESRT